MFDIPDITFYVIAGLWIFMACFYAYTVWKKRWLKGE